MKQRILAVLVLTTMMIGFAAQFLQQAQATSPLTNLPDIQTDALSQASDKIVLGLGCFWGAEKRFEAMPGVINVLSGYADGQGVAPTYRAITAAANKFNPNNHAEVIEVTFNPMQISVETLIKAFFEMHDPTQANRQGNDIGSQYRSTILYRSDAQKNVAEALRDLYQEKLSAANYGKIKTLIKPLQKFYPAEAYHQDYITRNPNGYCPDHSTGVTFGDRPMRALPNIDNSALLTGKHIVVIDAADCPYCEKFKIDVANDYHGPIPLHFRRADQLSGLTITSATWATPTLIFLADGSEVFSIRGYIPAGDFYKAVGAFQLGDSEAYNVAFNQGTDARFCKQYDLFKNTPDGVFIDKLSGAHLFDTRDRFDSGTGWLSFTQPIAEAVTYHEDHRYGMQRTEIKAKISGIHLGHVFNDGPNGRPRYCINATVLAFIPRNMIE